jgi:hypothetical protein
MAGTLDDFIPVISSLKQTATGVKSSFTTLPPIFCNYQFWYKIDQMAEQHELLCPKIKMKKITHFWRPWVEDSTIFLAPNQKVALAFFDIKNRSNLVQVPSNNLEERFHFGHEQTFFLIAILFAW